MDQIYGVLLLLLDVVIIIIVIVIVVVIVIPAIYSDEEYLIIQLCQTKLKSSWGIIWFDPLKTI